MLLEIIAIWVVKFPREGNEFKGNLMYFSAELSKIGYYFSRKMSIHSEGFDIENRL